MLQYRYDPLHALAVLVVSPPSASSDIDEYVDCIQKLDGVAAGRAGAALVMVLDAGYPLPDAVTRKRVVDARQNMKSRPSVAVVTSNPLLRAAIAAARWLSPPPYEQDIVGTFDEAVTAIEARRGSTIGVLQRLYRDARGASTRP